MYDDEALVKQLRQQIKEDSALCRQLHARTHESYAKREHSEKKRWQWREAGREFNEQKEQLIFPGGTHRIYGKRPHEWDFWTVEAALCFLEVRPYHFNSGYVRTHLMRHLKKAYLTGKQSSRLAVITQRHLEWKEIKKRRISEGL